MVFQEWNPNSSGRKVVRFQNKIQYRTIRGLSNVGGPPKQNSISIKKSKTTRN